MKTHSIRLFPTKEQVEELNQLSDIYIEIWNKLIDVQQKEYENSGKILNKFNLINTLPKLKDTEYSHWKQLNSKAIQTIATSVFSSYRSFFTLIKKDKTARPPKIKVQENHFHVLTFNQSGWKFKNDIITINKIPFKFKSQRDYSKEDIKEIRVKFINNKWLVDLVINDKIEYAEKVEKETKILSLDMGLKNLANGIDNKGDVIVANNRSKKINKYFNKQIDKTKSKLSKCKNGSRKHKHLSHIKRKLLKKKNTQLKQTLHVQSKKLTDMNYNTIVIGDLKVKQLMKKRNNNKKGIRKSFQNSNVSMFIEYLTYKCQNKNINLTKIDERFTTQINCLTGKQFPIKIELKDRKVNITSDIVLDRDINSAINILKKYQEYHLASMNEPFSVTEDVLQEISCRKPIIL